MLQLDALGSLALRRADGGATGPLLTQPKRVAVLLYLALARPRGYHARDTLLGLLWADSDQSAGRHALRNALHGIRATLGEDVIVTRGEGQIGIDPALLGCDIWAFEAALAAKAFEQAVGHYRGDLCPGFYVTGAGEFERWVEGERTRLRTLAVEAARQWVESSRAAGDPEAARRAMRRAAELLPDETRGEFAAGAPSAETRALAATMRAAHAAADQTSDAPADPAPAAPPTPIPSRRRGLTGWRRWVATAATVVGVVAAIAAMRGTRGAVPAPAISGDAIAQAEAAAARNALPPRYQADTVLLARYLRAEAILHTKDPLVARDSFAVLTTEAPLFAPGWSGLACAYSFAAFRQLDGRDVKGIVEAAARRALALDSTITEAYVALAGHAIFHEWDLATGERYLQRGFTFDSTHPELHFMHAALQRWRGDLDGALVDARHAAALAPLNPLISFQVGWTLYMAHRCDEADAEFRRRQDVFGPTHGDWYFYRYLAQMCLGREAASAEPFARWAEVTGLPAYADSMRKASGPAARAALREHVWRMRLAQFGALRTREFTPAHLMMYQYASLENADSTLIWLDSMYVERSTSLHLVPFNPSLDFLRGDPRFQAFLERLPWKPRRYVIPARPNSVASRP